MKSLLPLDTVTFAASATAFLVASVLSALPMAAPHAQVTNAPLAAPVHADLATERVVVTAKRAV
jgi:hypothetical protein